jgi:hypothetical protein
MKKLAIMFAAVAVTLALTPIAPASAGGAPQCGWTKHGLVNQIDADGHLYGTLNKLFTDTTMCAD